MDESIAHYDRTDGEYFTWNPDNADAVYKMESDKIKCQNCPEDENSNIGEENSEIKAATLEKGILKSKTALSLQP